METSGLVVGPGYTPGEILLAASPRAKPGEYTVTLSATSETGEERQTTLDVVVEAQVTVPPSSTRPPVVLLNGWLTGFTNDVPHSHHLRHHVWQSRPVFGAGWRSRCVSLRQLRGGPGQRHIEALGNDLGAFLNTIKYDSGAQVPQIDLVAHSMGGLIARAYLAGIQPNSDILAAGADTGSQAGPDCHAQLRLVCRRELCKLALRREANPPNWCRAVRFLWNLATWNQLGDDLRGVNAIAVVGNAGSYMPNLSSSYVFQ